MSNRKFVRGSYTLAANITDPDAYYQEHKAAIDGVIKWADQVGMYVGFGTSSDNTYLCEYETTQNAIDPDSGFLHLQHIATNISFLLQMRKEGKA